MLDFEVLSCIAYLYTICRDATNTCEVDTPNKPPNVLLNLKGSNHPRLQLLALNIAECNIQYFWRLLTPGCGGGPIAPPLSFFLSN